MTIITSTLLNELENKFTAHGLGYEYIPDSEITYQKCVDAIENGYIPLLDDYYIVSQYRITSNTYYIDLNNSDYYYSASSPTEIMTRYQMQSQ